MKMILLITLLIMTIPFGCLVIHSVLIVMNDIPNDSDLTFAGGIVITLVFIVMLSSTAYLIYLIV